MIRAGEENAHEPGDCPPMPTPWLNLLAWALIGAMTLTMTLLILAHVWLVVRLMMALYG
jgi:hypothetical protein